MYYRFMMWLLALGLAVISSAQTVPEQPKPLKMPFEQANAIVKFDCTQVDLDASGRSTTVKHFRTALLTDRAIRENSQDVTVYNLGYDTVEVLYARVHLPAGKTVDVGEDAIKDVPMPAFGKFYLQNVREKIITFPQLEQGAEIEVAYRETTRDVPVLCIRPRGIGSGASDPGGWAWIAAIVVNVALLAWLLRVKKR